MPEPLCPQQERHTSRTTLSQAAPGTAGTFPGRPLLQRVWTACTRWGPPGGWAISLPISARGPRSGAAPWWHVASTTLCEHHCCCHPRGDLCAHPRASHQTNPTAHILQQQQSSTSGVCRAETCPCHTPPCLAEGMVLAGRRWACVR